MLLYTKIINKELKKNQTIMSSIKSIYIFKFIWVILLAASIVLLALYQLHFTPLEKILILSITLILFFSTYMLFLSDKRLCCRDSNKFDWNCDTNIGTPLESA